MSANYLHTVVEPREAAQRVKDEEARVAAQKAAEEAQAALEAVQAPAPVVAVDTSDAKLWIYMHESGNDPTRWNSSGCLGLGQACPASKLLAVCPNQDYACEDAWFTSYMQSRYGSWENAKAFWLANNWW